MMVWTATVLLLLAPVQSFAQSRAAKKPPAKSDSATQWPIQSLSVEGNRNYTAAQIVAVSGLKVGQLAGKSEFEAARDRLVATGAFETVSYRFAPAKDKDAEGYAASFQVVEAGPIYPLGFEGLKAPAAEISAWLKSKDPLYGPKIPATSEMLTRYARSIEEFLATKNLHEKVAGKLVPTGPNQFAIVFRTDRPLATIAEVNFEGNQAVPTTLLQKTIAEVGYGFPYTEAGFLTLLDNSIRPLYDGRGRVGVTFTKVVTEKAKNDVNGLAVTVTVNEGPEFRLGDVRITGSYVARSAELLKLGAFKKGEVANFDELGKGIDRIKRRLRHEGYLHADTAIERTLHHKPETVDVAIRIDEGPQFLFGTLTVQGLDLTGEAEIKKLWGLHQGKPFNADYPDYFLERVQQDGVFDNLHKTKAMTKVDDQAHLV